MRKVYIGALCCSMLACYAYASDNIQDKAALFLYARANVRQNAEVVEKILITKNGIVEFYKDHTCHVIDFNSQQQVQDRNKVSVSQYTNLNSIYLVSCELGTELAREILTIAANITTFSLCDVKICSENDITLLQQSLSAMTKLKAITLKNVYGCKNILYNLLSKTPVSALECLNVDAKVIAQEEVDLLGHIIMSSKMMDKISINIANDLNLSYLIKALYATANLSHVDIGVHTNAATITQADQDKGNSAVEIKRAQMPHLLQAISKHTSLRHLAIRYGGRDVGNFVALFDSIFSTCKQLNSVDFSGLKLDNTSAVALLRSLSKAESLILLNIAGLKLNKEVGAVFAKTIQSLKNINRLILDRCFSNIDSGEAVSLIDILPWDSLKKLSLCDNDFRGMNIDFAQRITSQSLDITAYNSTFSSEQIQNLVNNIYELDKNVTLDIRNSKIYDTANNTNVPWNAADRGRFRDSIILKGKHKKAVVLGV